MKKYADIIILISIVLIIGIFSTDRNGKNKYIFVDTSGVLNSKSSVSGTLILTQDDTARWHLGLAVAPTMTQVIRTLTGVAYIPSSTRNTNMMYSIQIACPLTLTGGNTGTVFLEDSTPGNPTWLEINRIVNGNTGTLTLGLSTIQTNCFILMGNCLPLHYLRLRTTSVGVAGATFTYVNGQEMQF